jgi:hypothetical protein
MRWVGNTYCANSSRTSLAIWFARTHPLGVLITYDGLAIVSANFNLLAHATLMKSCDAPESNRMMIGRPNSKKVPTSTSSPSGISSSVVWLTRLLHGVGALIWLLYWITIDAETLGALPLLGSGHYIAKCSTHPQLKHVACHTQF